MIIGNIKYEKKQIYAKILKILKKDKRLLAEINAKIYARKVIIKIWMFLDILFNKLKLDKSIISAINVIMYFNVQAVTAWNIT